MEVRLILRGLAVGLGQQEVVLGWELPEQFVQMEPMGLAMG